MSRSVTSFDIFDTLLARRVRNPTDIFVLMERQLPYPGFARLRQTAQDQSDHTFADIYAKFQKLTGCDDVERQRISEMEIQTEMANLYLIQSMASMVNEGDLLVSDMYHTEETLRRLLRVVGFVTNVDVYVSSSGKASGKAWEYLLQRYHIVRHYGDNQHSDVDMAGRYGIPATHVSCSFYTRVEDLFHETSPLFASHIREFRLSNPHVMGSWRADLYHEQANHNLPLLLYLAHRIAEVARERRVTRVLFTTRDCCLLRKVFAHLYGRELTPIEFHASRMAYTTGAPDYVEYVKGCDVLNEDAMIVDLHGSFRSLDSFFHRHFGRNPKSLCIDHWPHRPIPNMVVLWQNVMGNLWEALNADNCGTLVTIARDGVVVRAPPEHDLVMSRFMHKVVDDFIRRGLPSVVPMDEGLWRRYIGLVRQESRIQQYIDNQFEHARLTELANKHRTDKGTTYACAHGYASTYEHVIGRLLRPDHDVHLLEIGLNRDDSRSIPSINMFREYFHHRNIVSYGFDIDPAFSQFDNPHDNVHIIIGDQSDPESLTQCHGRAEYDLIIDDGSHASSHQQITLSSLWSCVRPGGCYAIEDLHYQPFEEACIGTKELVLEWQRGNWVGSEHVPAMVVKDLEDQCARIETVDSQSAHWDQARLKHALVLLWKKES